VEEIRFPLKSETKKIGKGSSSQTSCIVRVCDDRRRKSIGRLQSKWLDEQMDGLGLDSNSTSPVRNLRLSLPYVTAIFMTCLSCAQNPHYFPASKRLAHKL